MCYSAAKMNRRLQARFAMEVLVKAERVPGEKILAAGNEGIAWNHAGSYTSFVRLKQSMGKVGAKRGSRRDHRNGCILIISYLCVIVMGNFLLFVCFHFRDRT